MKRSTVLVGALIAVHTVVTTIACYQAGLWEIFRIAFTNWGAGQIFSDLSVSLVFISIWILSDAKKQGIPGWPFVLAMLPLGSFAWMAYFVVRSMRGARPSRNREELR